MISLKFFTTACLIFLPPCAKTCSRIRNWFAKQILFLPHTQHACFELFSECFTEFCTHASTVVPCPGRRKWPGYLRLIACCRHVIHVYTCTYKINGEFECCSAVFYQLFAQALESWRTDGESFQSCIGKWKKCDKLLQQLAS